MSEMIYLYAHLAIERDTRRKSEHECMEEEEDGADYGYGGHAGMLALFG